MYLQYAKWKSREWCDVLAKWSSVSGDYKITSVITSVVSRFVILVKSC